jgi:hypothetical protein
VWTHFVLNWKDEEEKKEKFPPSWRTPDFLQALGNLRRRGTALIRRL